MWTDQYDLLLISTDSSFCTEWEQMLSGSFKIHRAPSEQVAFFLIREVQIKLVLIDLRHPLHNVVQTIRSQFGNALYLFGLGQAQSQQVSQAFRSGVDQYFLPNSSPDFMLMSLQAAKKRLVLPQNTQAVQSSHVSSKERSRIQLGPIEVFPFDHLAKVDGINHHLSPIQFKLLLAFVSKTDELLTREWLQENVWENLEISPRSIDAQVSKLKKTIHLLTPSIINVYGKGYILNSQVLFGHIEDQEKQVA